MKQNGFTVFGFADNIVLTLFAHNMDLLYIIYHNITIYLNKLFYMLV